MVSGVKIVFPTNYKGVSTSKKHYWATNSEMLTVHLGRQIGLISGEATKSIHQCTEKLFVFFIFYLHAVLESAEVINLSAKDKIGQLCICQEDDKKHNCKANDIFDAARHGCGQLTHRSVEVNELEKLLKEETNKQTNRQQLWRQGRQFLIPTVAQLFTWDIPVSWMGTKPGDFQLEILHFQETTKAWNLKEKNGENQLLLALLFETLASEQ